MNEFWLNGRQRSNAKKAQRKSFSVTAAAPAGPPSLAVAVSAQQANK